METAADHTLLYILLTIVASLAILFTSQTSKGRGVGLPVAYVMNFALNHLFGAIAHLFPWYVSDNTPYVKLGFEESAIGLLSFAAGCLLVAPLLVRMSAPDWKHLPARIPDPRLPKAYIATGFVFYFLLLPLIRSIPSVSALGYAGWSLMILGICLAAWNVWTKRRGSILRWVALGMVFPAVTVLRDGFIGNGLAAVFVVLSFVATFYRPRWKILVAGLLAVYLGLSVFVTYLRDRTEYRAAVWYEEVSYGERLGRLYKTAMDFEFFDVYNEDHLLRIDDRLNQNILVGQVVDYLGGGYIEYARGSTLWEALISVVPRIIWPGKPVTAGSGNYVAIYTGNTFAEGTSVGMGQVLEFYINFGRRCVIIGFLVLGAVLGFLDKGAGYRLSLGDWKGCAFWFLPGVALLQAGGSLVEVFSTFAGGIVFCVIVNQWVVSSMSGRRISWRRWARLFGRGRGGAP